jgi:hypothetical protein
VRLEKDLFLQSSGYWQGFCEKEENFREIEEKLSSYLNERLKFGYAESSEMYQLKALEIMKKNWNPELQYKLRLGTGIL